MASFNNAPEEKMSYWEQAKIGLTFLTCFAVAGVLGNSLDKKNKDEKVYSPRTAISIEKSQPISYSKGLTGITLKEVFDSFTDPVKKPLPVQSRVEPKDLELNVIRNGNTNPFVEVYPIKNFNAPVSVSSNIVPISNNNNYKIEQLPTNHLLDTIYSSINTNDSMLNSPLPISSPPKALDAKINTYNAPGPVKPIGTYQILAPEIIPSSSKLHDQSISPNNLISESIMVNGVKLNFSKPK